MRGVVEAAPAQRAADWEARTEDRMREARAIRRYKPAHSSSGPPSPPQQTIFAGPGLDVSYAGVE